MYCFVSTVYVLLSFECKLREALFKSCNSQAVAYQRTDEARINDVDRRKRPVSIVSGGRFMALHLWPNNFFGLLREFQSLPIPLRFSLLRCCMGGRSHQLANMIMDQSVHDDR